MFRRRLLLVLAVAGAALVPAEARPADPADPAVLLENARVLPVSGPALPRASVLLRGSRIEAVGVDLPVPEGARRVDLSGKTLCPGFVDAASRVALAASDRAGGPRDPGTPAADGFDPGDPSLAAALAGGVTSLLLSPGAPPGSFAGRTALVKTGSAAGGGRVAARDGAVKAVLGPRGEAPSLDRAAAAERVRGAFRDAVESVETMKKYRRALRDFLEEAAVYAATGDAPEEAVLPPAVLDRLRRLDPEPREEARRSLRAKLGLKEPEKPPKVPRRPTEPKPDDQRDLLLAATRGEVGVRFEAHSVEDLRAALALAGEFHLKISIEGAAEGARAGEALSRAKVPVACWPCDGPGVAPDGPPASAVSGALAAADVRVAVASGDEGPLSARHLPLVAALAAGHGLGREAALRALTLDAAEAAGFADRIGSLEKGKDADLVVLDGDPLDPAARILAVWVDGVEFPAAAPR